MRTNYNHVICTIGDVVWGIGKDMNEAVDDAKVNYGPTLKDYELKVLHASNALAEAIDCAGGGKVEFKVEHQHGLAMTPREYYSFHSIADDVWHTSRGLDRIIENLGYSLPSFLKAYIYFANTIQNAA